jgi:phosphopantothenoylcysteine decarboxylase/phosphopantothenate--cysteine ligase
MKMPQRKVRVVLGVTGSIACYKGAELARFLMKRGCDVRVVMTPSATKFVAPLTFQALTGNSVSADLWSEGQPGVIGHIELADWADVVVVAPATADTIAKMAYGFAESSLLAVVLATKAPVVVAPAMNVNMLEHPATQSNITTLRRRGVHVVEPEAGHLACGWVGKGRLAPYHDIWATIERALGPKDLTGKKVLISAGPTREAIDPVRFLSNRSSGKMGVALAREAFRRGADVTLVHGPLGYRPTLAAQITRAPVTTAAEMYDAIVGAVFKASEGVCFDIVVMAAAVADFRPAEVADRKLKKSIAPRSIELAPNEDIVAELGRRRSTAGGPLLVGFAVETGSEEALIQEAQSKLARKNLDLVVGNLAADSFDKDTNRVWIVSSGSAPVQVDTQSKRRIAIRVWDAICHKATRQF